MATNGMWGCITSAIWAADQTMGRRLFDLVTDNQLQWAPMDPVYDRLFIGERQIDLMAGPKAFVDS